MKSRAKKPDIGVEKLIYLDDRRKYGQPAAARGWHVVLQKRRRNPRSIGPGGLLDCRAF